MLVGDCLASLELEDPRDFLVADGGPLLWGARGYKRAAEAVLPKLAAT